MNGACAVGLVGCGRWGKHILRDLLELGCRVTVAAPDPASRRRAEQAGANVVGSIDALPALEGYVVATPSETHAEIVEALLGRGTPIFVEKPMTTDPAAALALARAAPDRLFVMHKWRYHPGVAALAEIARSGELGNVLGLETVRAQWGHSHVDVDCVWILAPHDLSIALEILGQVPEPRAAVAERIEGNVTHLVALLGESPWLSLEVSVRSPQRSRVVKLRCAEGVAVLDDAARPGVTVRRNDEPADRAGEVRSVSGEMPLLAELRCFVEHLGGGPAPRSSAAEGARIVEVIASLREQAGLDRVVASPAPGI